MRPAARTPTPTSPVKCPNCRYDLSGLDAERCPECGIKPLEFTRPRRARRHEAAVAALALAGLVSLVGSTFISIGLAVLVGSNTGPFWLVATLLFGPWLVPGLIFAAAAWLDDRAEPAMRWPAWAFNLAIAAAWIPAGLIAALTLTCAGFVIAGR